MSGTTKTVLLVGGVGLGAYLLLEAIRGSSKPGPSTGVNSDYVLFSGLANLGAHLADAISLGQGRVQPSVTPTYVIGQGYVSGGAFAPIDPSTGGVVLPSGESYGPRLPS